MNLLMKKYKFVSILSILAIIFTLSPVSAFAAEPLTDLSGHWAKEQIQSFVDSGYVQGYPNGTFKPDNDITRAEFMTIANKAFGFTEKAEISYTDVKAGSWYADTVAVAKAAGYINGYPNGTMKPDSPITREEAAVIVTKIDGLTSNEAAANTFADGKDLAAWSKGSIGACADAKIFNGYPNGSFQAANLIERGETVVALSKALAYKNAPVAVAATVTDINKDGFQINLTPAVDGLTLSAITLAKGDTNVTVSAITTTTTGAAYSVTADLEEGQTYKLSLAKDGYNFGADITFTVLTDQTAADAVNTAIAALPATAELTLDNKAAVNSAKEKLDALTVEQVALVTDANKTKLTEAINKIAELQTAADQQAADQAAANAVTAKITALPEAADITLDNADAVNEAKTAFDALTDPQKALISNEDQTKLTDAIAKIDSLQNPVTQ